MLVYILYSIYMYTIYTSILVITIYRYNRCSIYMHICVYICAFKTVQSKMNRLTWL